MPRSGNYRWSGATLEMLGKISGWHSSQMSIQNDSHVESLKSPRGYFLFSTWGRKNTSEVSFDSSEVSFDSSEEFFLAYVENFPFPREYLRFSTWGLLLKRQRCEASMTPYCNVTLKPAPSHSTQIGKQPTADSYNSCSRSFSVRARCV